MPLTSQALTTVATATAAIDGSPTSATVERLINAVSDAMAKVANRTFERANSTTELHKGEGTFRLVLRRVPVASISAIALLDIEGNVATTYASTEYTIEDSARGFVYRPAGWISTGQDVVGLQSMVLTGTERKSIRVTYSGGYITPWQADASYPGGALGTRDMPYDLEEACIQSVVALYRNASRDRFLASKTTEGTSVAWYQGPRKLLTPETEAVARSFWRPSQ